MPCRSWSSEFVYWEKNWHFKFCSFIHYKVHFNIIPHLHPSLQAVSFLQFFLPESCKNFSCLKYMPCSPPVCPLWFVQPTHTNFSILLLLFLKSRHFPQQPVVEHPLFVFTFTWERPGFTHVQSIGKVIALCILMSTFWESRQDDNRSPCNRKKHMEICWVFLGFTYKPTFLLYTNKDSVVFFVVTMFLFSKLTSSV